MNASLRQKMSSLLLVVVSGSVVGCLDNSVSPSLVDPAYAPAPCAPAHRIATKGSFLRLGSDDPLAAPEERPGWTNFQHDFWLDTTEMTQEEFLSLMGRNPSNPQGNKFPVNNVTWFDAVLAANERSKRDGLDTVYSYSGKQQGKDGSVWDLQGVIAHLGRGGWRLPTEAEWEAAARGGTTSPWAWGGHSDSARAKEYAWYQQNSGGRLHEVAALAPNAYGLHDMAGNVMEWVHDWKGSFPDSSVDYAGQQSPSPTGDKPVKGGSFQFGLGNLRPSARSSTYATLPSASTEYVGFRLARGAIASPRFGLPGGSTLDALPPVSWSATLLRESFGYRNAKVAFVQVVAGKRFLSWIDFGEASPVLRQFPEDYLVFHPVISPDGQWVAWSTVQEGSRQAGRIRVRRLSSQSSNIIEWAGTGAIPRWWVRPGSTDTFLVAASSAMDNTSSDWENQSTRLLGFSNGAFTSDAVLASEGAFHDGLSSDGRFLTCGYRRLKTMDLRNHTTSVEFAGPSNGKAAGDTSQMCNVSIAPDSSGDVLGLDFGYSGVSTLLGRPYGIHEVAFRIRRGGSTTVAFTAPPHAASLEDLEWTSDPAFAISSVVDAQGTRRGVWLFDLSDGSAHSLVEGIDLWHPNLWIEPHTAWISAFSDSAGAYNTPASDFTVEELANKLVHFWPMRDSIQVAAVGSSHTRFGIAPASMRSFSVFNFGAAGGPYDLGDTLITRYVLPHSPMLRFVVLEISPGWFSWRVCDGVCEQFEQTVGRVFDRNHSVWKDSLPERILAQMSQRRWNGSDLYSRWGQFDAPTNGWGGADPTNYGNHDPAIDTN